MSQRPSKLELACTLIDELIESGGCDLFRSTVDEAGYAIVEVAGGTRPHFECHPVKGGSFSRWLRHCFWDDHEKPLHGEALAGALAHAEMRAQRAASRDTFVRVAHVPDAVLVDAGDANWGAWRITSSGWQYESRHEVPFVRGRGMAPLARPIGGRALVPLLRHILGLSKEQAVQAAAWVIAAFSDGPLLVLVLAGEQGTGKSTCAIVLRRLVDPSVVPLRSPPRESRDLVAGARLSYVLAYDNISVLPQWLSDALSMIATGGGYEARTLYTDLDETLVRFRRAIIINGIEGPARNADLVDRAVLLQLTLIDDSARRTEAEIAALVDDLSGELVGAVFAGISAALRNLASTPPARWARMVDATTWAIAAADALGTDRKTLETVMRHNRAAKDDLVIEGSALAQAMLEFAVTHSPWEGTTSELKVALEENTPTGLANAGRKGWPANASALGSQIARELPALRRKGLSWEELPRSGTTRKKQLKYEAEPSREETEEEAREATPTSRVSQEAPKLWSEHVNGDNPASSSRDTSQVPDDARHARVTADLSPVAAAPSAEATFARALRDRSDTPAGSMTRSPDLVALERVVAATVGKGDARLYALDGAANPFASPTSAPRLGYITSHQTVLVLDGAARRILRDQLDEATLATALGNASSFAVGDRTVTAVELPLGPLLMDSSLSPHQPNESTDTPSHT